MDFDEENYKDFVKPHILRGRDGDWNHAKRVVKWVKELGAGNENLELLITAAYIHDIGWRDVLPPQKLSFEKLLEYEPRANENSEPFIREVLSEYGFSEEEMGLVLKYVSAADEHKSTDTDEAIIVDADNLSKLSSRNRSNL